MGLATKAGQAGRGKPSGEPPKSYAVMIIDMARTAEPDSGSRVSGFPTYELAKEFLKRRVRDSIEELTDNVREAIAGVLEVMKEQGSQPESNIQILDVAV